MIIPKLISTNSPRFKKSAGLLVVLLALMISAPYAFAGKVYIPKGTEISVSYKVDISTGAKSRPAGDEILEIAADQTISNVKYLKKGGKVYCDIIKFKKPGLLGGGGTIEIRVDSVQTTLGKNISVENQILKAQGKSKKLKAIGMLPLLGYGLLVKGDHAKLAKRGETVVLKIPELISISY
jgi:hypothetical protein